MRFSGAATSNVGEHRAVNQDSAFTAPWGAAVADGVGGGPSGDLASAALIHRLISGVVDTADAEKLSVGIRLANWDLRAHAKHDPTLEGMATTLTGIFAGAHQDRVLLAHTGDSRGYLLRDGTMVRVTRDDSFVQELVDRGIVKPEDATSHPRRNIITASLGGRDDDTVRVVEHDVRAHDRWMLCSDGVTDFVSEADLAVVLASEAEPGAAADAIVALALQADTRDNATAVVVDIQVDAAAPHEAAHFYGAARTRFCEGLDTP